MGGLRLPVLLLMKSFMVSQARAVYLAMLGILILLFFWMPGQPRAQSSPAIYSLTFTISNQGVAYDSKTNLIVAADYKSNVVQLINLTTGVSTSVAVGTRPVAAAIYATSKKSYAYIGNEGSDAVSVIDLSTKSVIKTIPVGQSPVSIAINSSTGIGYVTNFKSDNVSILNLSTNTVAATTAVGSEPASVAINTATKKVYVANSKSDTVSVIDGTSNAVTATIPVGQSPVFVVVNSGKAMAYSVNSKGNSVSAINLSTNAVTAMIPVGSEPVSIAIDTGKNTGYVANLYNDSVSVLNLSTNTVTGAYAVGRDPIGVAYYSPYLIVATQRGDGLWVINTTTQPFGSTVPVGKDPDGIAVDPTKNRALTANEKTNDVSIVDLSSVQVIATIPVGGHPTAVAINSETQTALVANEKDDTLSVIDLTTKSVVGTIAVGKSPVGVAINPHINNAAIANSKSDSVSVVDISNHSIIGTLAVGRSPSAVAIQPAGNIGVVTNKKDNTASILDLSNRAVIATIPVGKDPAGVAIDSDLNLAVVTNNKDNTASIIDLSSKTVVAVLPVGKGPQGVGINPSTHKAAVANFIDDSITVIDLPSRQVVQTLAAGKSPAAVDINPNTNQAAVALDSHNLLTVLQLNNPAPVISELVPVSFSAGEPEFTLTVQGSQFITTSVVEFNGQSMATQFVSTTKLNASIPASAITTAGTVPVTVTNPAPEGGTSNSVSFSINNPTPILTSLVPDAAMAGSSQGTLVVNGQKFVRGAIVYFAGQSLETTFVNSTQLSAIVPATLFAQTGLYEIMVINPGPGGGPSNVSTFTVSNPVPALTSLAPTCVLVGSGNTLMTINGANFVASSMVQWNETPLTTTYVSPAQLSSTIPSSLLASAGTFSITIANPAPGGGTSAAQTITVNNPVPSIASILPTSIAAGSGSFTLMVNGTDFLSSSIVSFNGHSLATTFVNSTQLTATVPASDVAAAQTAQIAVLNPAPGGGDSQAAPFIVTQEGNPNVEPLPAGSFGKQYEDLIPPDATIAAYTPKRFAIVTGLVKDRNLNPIPDVKVSFLGRPEYGTAHTDADGRFNLPVDGGGAITVVFEKGGLITSHRQVNAPWNDIINTETITMLAEDTKATTITFDGNPATVLVHTSTTITDDRGSRSLTMVFTGDNRATVTDANGNQSVMTTITTRATEFDTPESMPAKLPPTSAYTYCSELSVDEAKSVKFDKPVTLYVDNFLGFNVGEIVPVGYYDRSKGVWMASDNGIVVRLLDTNGDGIVDALDSNGDGLPNDLNSNGFLNDEVVGLSNTSNFKPNSTYWRLSVDHFSPWDPNFPMGPPLDAIQPNPGGDPVADQQQGNDDTDCTGSYCERKSRIIHEDVPILGTDMTLHYASNRVLGYKTVVTIPASGITVPPSLKRIIVRMEVAGRLFETTLPPQPNQKVEFQWDGQDYRGKSVSGSSVATISIGFVYTASYYSVGSNLVVRAWAQVGSNSTYVDSRAEITSWKKNTILFQRSGYDSIAEGWTLSAHHYISPFDVNTLVKGDGTTIENNTMMITTVAGNGSSDYSGDGGPATLAGFQAPEGLAVDSKGNIYIADSYSGRIRRVDDKGIIETVAGNGDPWSEELGDGGPATQATIRPLAATVDETGNIYIVEVSRIRKVDSSGIIRTVAGNGIQNYPDDGSGDGSLATEVSINANCMAVDHFGNIYFGSNGRVRKVDTNGIITTVAGRGDYFGGSFVKGDGGPATQASLHNIVAVAVDCDGSLYIADGWTNTIKKVDSSGTITTIAGNYYYWDSGDGGLATQASIYTVHDVALDSVGNIYLSSGAGTIRKVDTRGIIIAVVGKRYNLGFSGDDGPATKALLNYYTQIAVDRSGKLYILDVDNKRVRKVSFPDIFYHKTTVGDIPFVDEKGLKYVADSTGRHKSTIDLATGKTMLTFGYDQKDQLISVTDRFGNQTTIQRDMNGMPTSITSPDGQIIGLTVDSSKHLTKVTYTDGSFYSFGYTPDGLMTDEYDRRGNQFIHQYDSNGKITNVGDPEGGSWSYAYTADSSGNVFSSVLTGEDNLVTYQDKTDSTGAYTSTKTDPTGEITTIWWSSDALTETMSSSCGMKQSRQYDLDAEYKFEYITAATTTTPAGLKLISAYSRTYKDNNGDKVPDLITDTMTQNSKAWTTINNTLTGSNIVTSPGGRSVTAQYDPATLLTQQITVPGLYPTSFGYDARGRLVSATTGSRTATVSYDPNGYPDYMVTPDNKTYDYAYDIMGRLRAVQQPGGTTINYDYDPNGNMTVLTNPKTISNGFDYTGTNLRKTWTAPLSGSYQYTYDKEKKLKTITFPSGKVISNTYTHGLLTVTTTPEGTISYTYGCGSNLLSVLRGSESASFTYDGSLLKTDTRAGQINQTISYVYNNDFNLSSVTYAGVTQTFSYDNDGLLTAAGAYTIARNAQNGLPEVVSDGTVTVNRMFSGYGEMDENTYTVNGTPLYDWTVSRDNAGRITQKIENMQESAMVWDYGYDKLGRLTEVKQNYVVVESYTYDADGNRLTEMNNLRYVDNRTYTYSTEDNIITAGTDTYQFDKDGFLTSKTTSDGITTYNYSSRGELLNVILSDSSAISYDHDPMGRRITKKVNGVVVEKYLWQGMTRLLAIYDGSDNLIVRFNYVDGRMPVSMIKSGVTYYLAYDQIGSLRAVMAAGGSITKEILYDSFGAVIYESNSSFTVPFGFAGGLYDKDTGLVRFGFRDYDPNIGKWTAKDPIDFRGGDANLFGYVGNNPVNWVDHSGLLAAPWHAGISFIAGLQSGMGLGDSLSFAWDTMAVDFASGSQGFDAAATSQHAMAGTLSDGSYQDYQEAINAANSFIQNNKNCGNYANAAHAAQDLATPMHTGQPWTGFGWNLNTVLHVLGDLTPYPSTVWQAYLNTLGVLK